jgi:hypothetical protein
MIFQSDVISTSLLFDERTQIATSEKSDVTSLSLARHNGLTDWTLVECLCACVGQLSPSLAIVIYHFDN